MLIIGACASLPRSESGPSDALADGALEALATCISVSADNIHTQQVMQLDRDSLIASFKTSEEPGYGAVYMQRNASQWKCKDIALGPPGLPEELPMAFVAQLNLDAGGRGVVPLVLGTGVDEVDVVESGGRIVDQVRRTGMALVRADVGDQIRLLSKRSLVLATSVAPTDLEVEPFDGSTSRDESSVVRFVNDLLSGDLESAARFIYPGIPGDQVVEGLSTTLSGEGIDSHETAHGAFFGFEVAMVGDDEPWNLVLVLARVDADARLVHYELKHAA